MCLLLLAAARPASARPGIDAEQFRPAFTGDSYFAVDGAFVIPHLTLQAGAWLTYAHDPLEVQRGTRSGAVLGGQLGFDVGVSLGIIDRLEIGLLLPSTFNVGIDNSILRYQGGIAGAGLGDLTLDIKGLPLDARVHGHRLGLALAFAVTAPTGNSSAFASWGGWTGRPRLIFEWRAPHDRVGLAVDFGAVIRNDRSMGSLYVTNQLSYGLGLRVNATHGLTVLGEARGLTNAAANVVHAELPFELAAGLRWTSRFGLMLEAGGGVGLTKGYGTPDGRFLFGIGYRAALKKHAAGGVVDRDLDGVPDESDKCPELAGSPANQGCPVHDIDGDGIEDDLDKCPTERGPMVNMGCPDFDSDQDGVPDRADKCPEMPGPKDREGCPVDDRDHDGVVDVRDRCPDQAGSPANDGCPDVDSDGDGIVDRVDKCPFDPEVFNDLADDDGCPDPGAALAEVTQDRIALKEPIVFDGKTKIDAKSRHVLNVVAKLLELHPEIKKVRVEGHTDNHGSAIDNLDLSRDRAAAVRHYLVNIGGIDGSRLVAQGFGPDRPIADNRTEAGRAKNRRIEIVIIERAGTP